MLEKRRLITVLIHNGSIPFISPLNSFKKNLSKHQALFIFGLTKRLESDIDLALRLALSSRKAQSQTLIQEVETLVENGSAKLNFEELTQELSGVELGEIAVLHSLRTSSGSAFQFSKSRKPGYMSLEKSTQNLEQIQINNSLIGRQKELKEFHTLLEQIQVDQGQLASLVGKPGIGKTHLLHQFRTICSEHNIPIFEGEYTLGKDDVLAAFRSIALHALEDHSSEELLKLKLIEADIHYLSILSGKSEPHDHLKDVPEAEIHQSILFSLRNLLRHLSNNSPIVFLIEDLHWAPKDIHETLRYLLDDFESYQILFMSTQRPEFIPPWQDDLNYNAFHLNPFSLDEIESYVRETIEADYFDSNIFKELEKLSLGNPLYVDKLLSHAIEKDFFSFRINEKKQKTLYIQKSIESIPSDLHGLLSTKIDHLNPNQKDTLFWCSIFGPIADTEEIQAFIREQNGQLTEQNLEELFELEYLQKRTIYPRVTHRFSHDLVFEILQERLPSEESKKRNENIAWFLTRYHKDFPASHYERIARHFLNSQNDTQAIEYSVKAAEFALEYHRYQDAQGFLEQAHDLLDTLINPNLPSDKLHYLLSFIYLSIGNIQKASDTLEKWKSQGVQNPDYLQNFYKLKVKLYASQSNHKLVLQSSLKALANDPLFELEPTFDLFAERLQALIKVGKTKETLHEGYKVLRILNNSQNTHAKIRIWSRLAYCAKSIGYPELGMRFIMNAFSLTNEETPPKIRSEFLNRGVNALISMQKYQECILMCSEILKIAQKNGFQHDYGVALNKRGEIHTLLGNYSQALDDLKNSSDIFYEVKNLHLSFDSFMRYIDCLLDIGALEQVESEWVKKVRFKDIQRETAQKGIESILTAFLFHFRQNHKEASRYYTESAKLYLQSGDQLCYVRESLRSLIMVCEGQLKSNAEIEAEFKKITSEPIKLSENILVYAKLTAFYLSTNNIAVPGTFLDEGFDPEKEAPDSYLKQWLYVAKIKWLDHKGRFDEAQNLRKKYRSVRDELAKKVPEKYKAEFQAHPIFRIP